MFSSLHQHFICFSAQLFCRADSKIALLACTRLSYSSFCCQEPEYPSCKLPSGQGCSFPQKHCQVKHRPMAVLRPLPLLRTEMQSLTGAGCVADTLVPRPGLLEEEKPDVGAAQSNVQPRLTRPMKEAPVQAEPSVAQAEVQPQDAEPVPPPAREVQAQAAPRQSRGLLLESPVLIMSGQVGAGQRVPEGRRRAVFKQNAGHSSLSLPLPSPARLAPSTSDCGALSLHLADALSGAALPLSWAGRRGAARRRCRRQRAGGVRAAVCLSVLGLSTQLHRTLAQPPGVGL